MNLYKLLPFLLGLVLTQVCIAAPLLEGICEPQALDNTGSLRQFNELQCARALAPLRTSDRQVSETSVCESLLNVAYDLGVARSIADISARGIVCEDAIFAVVFDTFSTDKRSPLSGEVFGGLLGSIARKAFVSDSGALARIRQAVGDGRVVAVSINAKPLFRHYAEAHQLTYNDEGFRLAHTVVVRAVLRNAAGEPSFAVLVDSGGPASLYAVPFEIFAQAYESLTAISSHGVFISDRLAKVEAR